MPKTINEIHIIKKQPLPFIIRPKTVVTKPKTAYYTNWHRNIELLSCINGSGTVVLDDKSVILSKGETLIINSNVIHTVTGCIEAPFVYHCLIIDRSFCVSNEIDTDRIRFIAKIRNRKITELMNEVCLIYNGNNEYKSALIRKIVTEILIEICVNHKDTSYDTSVFTNSGIERTNAVLDYIREHYSEKITLDMMAKEIGISKYYLCREFKKITSYSVVEYINRLRCCRACEMINKGMTIREASEKCGFDSLPYFTETFKKYVGLLPSDLKKNSNK